MPLPVVTSAATSSISGMSTTLTGAQKTATSRTATEEVTSLDSLQAESEASTLPSSTPSSTLATSTRSSELLTATPSSGVPSSISWGPAITASSIPSTVTNGPDVNTNQPTGDMSRSGQNTLIATTTIGGTFILAFLIYALWRSRKGATYEEIIRFRPQSSTICLSPGPRHPDFTALPIYRESRYSVRSTNRGSMLSFSKLMQKRAPSPSSESFARGPWLRNQWKVAHPPTPTRTGHPLSQVMTAATPPTPPLKDPEMAHVPTTSQSERIRINRTASENDISKPWPTVSSREVPPSRDAEAGDVRPPPDSPKSDTHLQDDSRWSWTNSQAPPTPRMRTRSPTRRSSKSSAGSSSRFRKVHSWVRNQTERVADRIPEEQPSRPAPVPKLPPLKNKASKPTLAPITTGKPTKRLSKKSGPPLASGSRPTTAVSTKKSGDDFRPKTAG